MGSSRTVILTPVNVLIVEDDAKLASLLTRGLGEAGHGSRWSDSGEAAVGAITADSFDAVLDVGLPGIDGLEVCRRLRRAGFAGAVVILTARSELEERTSGLEAGADDYLLKPFSLDELVERLHAARRHGPCRPQLQSSPPATLARPPLRDDEEMPWPTWLAAWHPISLRSVTALIITLGITAVIVATAS